MRPTSRLRFWLAAAVFSSLFAASPAHAQCGPATVGYGNVGIVANNPFHAEVIVTRTGFPDLAAIPEHPPELVARDSQGRVRTERVVGMYKRDTGPERGTKVEQHLIMICDPVAQTLTQIDTLNATAKIIHSRTISSNQQRLIPAPAGTFCASRLLLNRPGHADGEDLGDKTIEGVQAHGERFSVPMPSAPTTSDSSANSTSDRWCSDDLSAVVLTTTDNPKSGAQSTVAMQKIERSEPDPSLFQIPPNYAVSESVAEPQPRANPSVPLRAQ
ncbi:MAG: hypothetical protein ACRD59_14505 [Candidatus Acidiferrales bacterium]